MAAVVAASGFVYIAAAAVRRRGAAWLAFGLTFVLIALTRLVALDAAAWVVAFAGVALVIGLVRGHWKPMRGLPLQTAAMFVMGAVPLLAVQASPMVGGLLVSAALLAHAGWVVYYHRADRVVGKSLAKFCCVLDLIMAVVVAIVALST